MKSQLFALLLVLGITNSTATDCTVSDSSKVDCGYMGIDQTTCQSKGCCWQQSSVSGVPWCFYSSGYVQSTCYNMQVIFFKIIFMK